MSPTTWPLTMVVPIPFSFTSLLAAWKMRWFAILMPTTSRFSTYERWRSILYGQVASSSLVRA